MNGILLPFILVSMVVLINKKDLMSELVNGPIYNAITWATTIGPDSSDDGHGGNGIPSVTGIGCSRSVGGPLVRAGVCQR